MVWPTKENVCALLSRRRLREMGGRGKGKAGQIGMEDRKAEAKHTKRNPRAIIILRTM